MMDKEIDWLLRHKYKGKKTPSFGRDVERLEGGEHIDYVIGFAEFLECKVDLSTRPLIPRPETEFWTEKVINEIRSSLLDAGYTPRILDLFCGSGCIGLAALKHVPDSKVDFADTEEAYFPGIRRSARWNKIPPSRLRTIHSDVLRSVRRKYDYILANPPYIPLKGRSVQASVLKQEPHSALFGGPDGLKFVRTLMRDGKKHLRSDGRIFIEFDPPQKTRIGALGRRYGYRVIFFKDQYGRFRYCSLKL